MSRSDDMILAWIKAMETEQPQYGPLLQKTVDQVGYPAIDGTGTIRTIRDQMDYWAAVGYMQGYAGTLVETMMFETLGSEYPKLEKAGDEPGMALALEKGEFYKTLHQWITSHEPQKLPLGETPAWLIPFVQKA